VRSAGKHGTLVLTALIAFSGLLAAGEFAFTGPAPTRNFQPIWSLTIHGLAA